MVIKRCYVKTMSTAKIAIAIFLIGLIPVYHYAENLVIDVETYNVEIHISGIKNLEGFLARKFKSSLRKTINKKLQSPKELVSFCSEMKKQGKFKYTRCDVAKITLENDAVDIFQTDQSIRTTLLREVSTEAFLDLDFFIYIVNNSLKTQVFEHVEKEQFYRWVATDPMRCVFLFNSTCSGQSLDTFKANSFVLEKALMNLKLNVITESATSVKNVLPGKAAIIWWSLLFALLFAGSQLIIKLSSRSRKP